MFPTASFGADCMAFSSEWIINRYCMVFSLRTAQLFAPRSMQRRSILPYFDGEAGRKYEQVQILIFWVEAAGEGTAQTTIDCRKSESEVSLRHE
jgi:hypothetical protein